MGKPEILISRCLLGEAVRYDGGDKRDDALLAALGGEVEWVGICPECESGFGVPHPPLKLTGNPLRLVELPSGRDRSALMDVWIDTVLAQLASRSLAGAVFKAKSPSCAVDSAPHLAADGSEYAGGNGYFVRAFRRRFPALPLAEESALRDPRVLAAFRHAIGLDS